MPRKRQVVEVQGVCHSQERCHPSRMNRRYQAQAPFIDGLAWSSFSFGCMNAALALGLELCTAHDSRTKEHTAHSSLLRMQFFQKSLFLQLLNPWSLGQQGLIRSEQPSTKIQSLVLRSLWAMQMYHAAPGCSRAMHPQFDDPQPSY